MPAGKGGYAVTITAIDDASKRIDAINKKLDSISAPVRRIQSSFSHLADSTGLRAFNDGLKGIHQRMAGIAAIVGRFAGPLAALSGGLGAAGIVDATKRWGDFGSSLLLASRRAGMSVSQLQTLGNASRIAKGTAEGAIGSAQELQRNLVLGTAGAPISGQFRAAMSRLGINDWQGKNAGQVMPEVLEKLAAIHNVQRQKYFGEAIFGGSFDQMQPMLEQGVQGFRKWIKEAQQAGVVTQKEIQDAYRLAQQQQILELSIEKTGYAIMGDLTPNIIAAEKGITAWIQANRGWLSTDISGTIHTIADDASGFATQANKVAHALGGWKTLIEAIIALKLASWAAAVITNMTPLKLAMLAILATIERIETFSERSQPKNLPIGSPFWQGVSPQEQSNYVNSPRSQAFLRSVGFYPPQWWNPGSWMNPGAPGAASGGIRPPTSAQGRATEDQLRKYFLSQGWSAAQTAGILSNVAAESGFDPYNVGDSGTSYGLFQLHNDRMQAFFDWARRKTGLMHPELLPPDKLTALEEQYAQWDLTKGPHAAVGRRLRTATSAGQAAGIFTEGYENPRNWQLQAERRAEAAPAFLSTSASSGGTLTHTVKGQATVNVNIAGAPPGSRVSALAAGDMFVGAPRVTMPMPSGAGPS